MSKSAGKPYWSSSACVAGTRTAVKNFLISLRNALTATVAPLYSYDSTVRSKLSAVQGCSPVFTTVTVRGATEGSEIDVPGVMKLRSGRPIVPA